MNVDMQRSALLLPCLLLSLSACQKTEGPAYRPYEIRWPQAYEAYWGARSFEALCVPFESTYISSPNGDAKCEPPEGLEPGDGDGVAKAERNAEILKRLPNIRAFTMTRTSSGSGEIAVAGNKVSSKGETQVLFTDYAQYRVDETSEGCLLLAGVGLRIEMEFTKVSGLAKGSISGVEYGASFKHAKGTISYSTFGIEGPLATAVASMPKPISERTIEEVMAKANRLLVQIRDTELTRLTPMVFGQICPSENLEKNIRELVSVVTEIDDTQTALDKEQAKSSPDASVVKQLEQELDELREKQNKLLNSLGVSVSPFPGGPSSVDTVDAPQPPEGGSGAPDGAGDSITDEDDEDDEAQDEQDEQDEDDEQTQPG